MAETGNMVAANPFLQKNIPTMPGNVGIGYAQGGLNVGTQAKASESLGVEKQEGAVSQGNLNAAKAELARQQTLLQQKQMEKAQKENERSQLQGQSQAAQSAANAAAQAAQSAQAEVGRAQADLTARNEQNAQIRANPGTIAPVATATSSAPSYTGQYSPVVPPAPVVSLSSLSTGNGGSATSAMQAYAANAPVQGYNPLNPPSSGKTAMSSFMAALDAIKKGKR